MRAHRAHVRYAQDETYRIEYIGLSTTIETGDGVKTLVPTADDSANSIGLEAVDYDLDDPHIGGGLSFVDGQFRTFAGARVLFTVFTTQMEFA